MFWGIILIFIAPMIIIGFLADKKQKKKTYLNEFSHTGKENINNTTEAEAAARTLMDRP